MHAGQLRLGLHHDGRRQGRGRVHHLGGGHIPGPHLHRGLLPLLPVLPGPGRCAAAVHVMYSAPPASGHSPPASAMLRGAVFPCACCSGDRSIVDVILEFAVNGRHEFRVTTETMSQGRRTLRPKRHQQTNSANRCSNTGFMADIVILHRSELCIFVHPVVYITGVAAWLSGGRRRGSPWSQNPPANEAEHHLQRQCTHLDMGSRC